MTGMLSAVDKVPTSYTVFTVLSVSAASRFKFPDISVSVTFIFSLVTTLVPSWSGKSAGMTSVPWSKDMYTEELCMPP